uniref:Uncharacterized protein n=1 Tax=Arundo donax TaxID=35708 RepID=A0A0A8Y024_ARUDO
MNLSPCSGRGAGAG